MFLHNDDAESLQRMLGLSVLPDRLLVEYHLRISMFHRAGGNGALGHLGLVELCRFLNLFPPNLEKVETRVEWDQVPADGSTRIMADVFGAWRPGVYRGIGVGGSFVVQLDGDPIYREVVRSEIRLAEVGDTPDDAVPIAEKPVILLPDNSSQTPEPVEATDPEPIATVPEPSKPSTCSWTNVERGTAVVVEQGGETLEAEFVGYDGGYVTATLTETGESVCVPADEVVLGE